MRVEWGTAGEEEQEVGGAGEPCVDDGEGKDKGHGKIQIVHKHRQSDGKGC